VSDGLNRASSRLVQQMIELAASWTGFHPMSIRPEPIVRLLASLRARGWTMDALARAALAQDPELVDAVQQVVVVGETYFFREPRQFGYIASDIVPILVAGRSALRVWSAGCATGEEAYSLAGTLLHAPARGSVPVRVLGTDLVKRNVEVARSGMYAARNVRPSGPMLYPILRHVTPTTLEIVEGVRSVTSFEPHNLLEPPPCDEGRFHLIVCRNVLVYFSAEAARVVQDRITSALEPGGVAIFGPMDVTHPVAGLERVGPPELSIYRRPALALTPVPPPSPPVRLPTEPPPALDARLRVTEPVALHLRYLAFAEEGDCPGAERVLDDLNRAAPDYLPGLVERALVCSKKGDESSALCLMKDVLRRAEALDPRHVLAGPEPLPAEFYATTARAFLQTRGVA
jgi:chemotaxis protein methyltransferase CheR